MSARNAFDIVIHGGNINKRTIAAAIIERALEHDGFVNVETKVPVGRNNKLSLLEVMRNSQPRLFEKHVVIQELTVLPDLRYYKPLKNADEDPSEVDEQDVADLEDVGY